jgi:hypothetical protein
MEWHFDVFITHILLTHTIVHQMAYIFMQIHNILVDKKTMGEVKAKAEDSGAYQIHRLPISFHLLTKGSNHGVRSLNLAMPELR